MYNVAPDYRHLLLMHWASSMAMLSNLRRTNRPKPSSNALTVCLHFASFQVDRSLKNIYRFLQRLSVGLEQIVFDQNMYDGRFMEEFNEAEFKLKAVGILLNTSNHSCGILLNISNHSCKQSY